MLGATEDGGDEGWLQEFKKRAEKDKLGHMEKYLKEVSAAILSPLDR
jgi:hypothetical protein